MNEALTLILDLGLGRKELELLPLVLVRLVTHSGPKALPVLTQE